MRRFLLTLAASAALVLGASAAERAEPAEPGAEGGPGLALLCAKALVCGPDLEADPQVVNRAVVLVRDGRIERVAPARDVDVPADYELVDLGDLWVAPGLIDLHSHVGGAGGLNDTVYQANPGLRIHPSVVPSNPNLERCVAAGVTTVLFIPGSGSNMGGVGVLMKTALPTYAASVVRHFGSLKVAQGDNPTRWGYGMGRSMMNWIIRTVSLDGLAYAAEWDDYEENGGEAPLRRINLDIFRELAAGRSQISTHSQIPHLVLSTIRIQAQELGLPVYLDHSTVGGWRYGALAEENGVAAIVGPRSVDTPSRGFINWARRRSDEGFVGVAAGYQQQGHTRIGFNTDAPVIAGEDLFLQAAMGVRYGLDDEFLTSVRGLTVVPALTAGIDEHVGHLSPGTHADLLVLTGHPADPRTRVERVWIEGQLVYDIERERQRY